MSDGITFSTQAPVYPILPSEEPKRSEPVQAALTPLETTHETLAKRRNWKSLVLTGCGIVTTYRLLDSGIAHSLGLETLRHGTSLPNFIGIQLNGPNPDLGGMTGGGSEIERWREDSKTWFHVANDSTYNNTVLPNPFLNELANQFGKRFLPKVYSALSGYNTSYYKGVFANTNETLRKVEGSFGEVIGFFTPTVKVRCTTEEFSNKFVKDDTMPHNTASRTHEKIGIDHLGIYGSLSQGLNTGVFQRVINNPSKAALGVVTLAAAAYVAKKTYDFGPCSLPL